MSKEDFQIKAYQILYRSLKKLYTFRIQKVVRKLKKDNQRKLEIENNDAALVEKINAEIKKLENQKIKLDSVTKTHLKMLALHMLTETYSISLEKQKEFFEKELPEFIEKIELFNQEDNEDIQLIKWFEQTIKDHKVYKETHQKLELLVAKMEQVIEKSRARKKNRKQNKKPKLKEGKNKSEDGEDGDGTPGVEEKEVEGEAEGEGIEGEEDNHEEQKEDNDSGSDIVLEDDEEKEERLNPGRTHQRKQQRGNQAKGRDFENKGRNNRQPRGEFMDRKMNRRDERKNYRDRDSSQRGDRNNSQRRERNFSQRGDRNYSQRGREYSQRNGDRRDGDRRDGDRRNGDRRNGDRRDGDRRDGDRRNGDRRNGDRRDGDRRNGDRRNGDRRNGDHRNGDRRNGDRSQGDRSFSRDDKRKSYDRGDLEPEVGKKMQRGPMRQGKSEDRTRGGSDNKKEGLTFDQMHPSWKAKIQQKQQAGIVAFQGTKEKLV